MELKQFITQICKYKKVIIAWVVGGIVLAILISIFQKPIYVAKSKWFIQKATSGSILSGMNSASEGNALANAAGLLFNNAANTAGIDAAILQSPEIIKEIIKRAKITNKEGNYISVNAFRKKFKVNTDKKLPFIVIEYSSEDPDQAMSVMEKAEEVFIEKNISAEAKKAQKNVEFLESQVANAELDAEDSAKRLKKYESKSKVVNIEEEAKQQQSRLLQLENNLASYKASLASVKSKVADLKSKLGIYSAKQAIEKSTIGTDVDITTLKEELLAKNNRLIALQVKYTDTHHAVIEAKDEIKKLKNEIEKRQKALIGKSIPAEKVEEIKSVKSGMIDDLVQYTTEETALTSKIKAIQDTLGEYNRDLSVLPSKKYNLTTLEFENEFQKSRLESIKLSYETARINEEFAKNTISIVKLDEAEYPEKPTYPNPPLYIIIGIALGLIFSYCNILVLESIDNKIRSSEQIETLSNYTYLGQVPCVISEDLNSGLVALKEDSSKLAEDYIKLRTNLKFLKVDTQNKNISFIYPETSEYPAIAMANLAISLAKTNTRTLLIDSNFRDQYLDKILGLQKIENGLSNYLAGNIQDYHGVVQEIKNVPNLYYMPAGTLPPNPSDILDSSRMKELISQLSGEYETVLYNLPAFKAYADTLIVTSSLNGNILVANSANTTTQDFSHTLKTIKKHNIEVIGSMLIDVKDKRTKNQ